MCPLCAVFGFLVDIFFVFNRFLFRQRIFVVSNINQITQPKQNAHTTEFRNSSEIYCVFAYVELKLLFYH